MPRTTIRSEDITELQVKTGDVAAGGITTPKMATDPTNASNLSSGSVPLAQLGNVDTTGLEADIALLAFKTQANGNLARYNLVDQSVDAFEDASGVDASASTGQNRSVSNYYFGGTSVTPTVTGGTITTDGAYKVHTFTSSGNYITDGLQSVDYLIIVGGGGGGGRYSVPTLNPIIPVGMQSHHDFKKGLK